MIEVTDTYAIDSDDVCVTVYKKRIPKKGKHKGKTQWDGVWYFPNYAQAFKGLLDREINGLNASGFEFVTDRIKSLKAEITAAMAKVPTVTGQTPQ